MKLVWLAPYPIINIRDISQKKSLGKIGKGMWLVNLLNALSVKPDINIHVITHCTKIEKDLVIHQNNVTYHLLKYQIPFIKKGFPNFFPIHKALHYPFLIKRIKTLLKKISPDLIHVHGTEDAYILAPITLDIPVIVSIQGVISEIYKRKKSLSYFFQKGIELKGIRSYSHFGCRTEFDKGFVKKNNPLAQIHYLPEAINELFFESNHKIEDNNAISFVGSISRAKGIEILLAAIQKVKVYYPTVKVNLIGPVIKDYSDKLKKIIENLGLNENIIFHGFKSSAEIVKLHLKSRVYVHPTFIDNSPNSLCEAMALGMPCIATNIGGIPSLIEDGENGLLTEAGNVNELAKKIILLLENNDLAKIIGLNARKSAFDRNYPSNVANITLKVYNNIISKYEKRYTRVN